MHLLQQGFPQIIGLQDRLQDRFAGTARLLLDNQHSHVLGKVFQSILGNGLEKRRLARAVFADKPVATPIDQTQVGVFDEFGAAVGGREAKVAHVNVLGKQITKHIAGKARTGAKTGLLLQEIYLGEKIESEKK